jgi:hypothetical protein
VNNINDQLDATKTILLIFESAQHVLGNHLQIFKSVRLWLHQCGVLSCKDGYAVGKYAVFYIIWSKVAVIWWCFYAGDV